MVCSQDTTPAGKATGMESKEIDGNTPHGSQLRCLGDSFSSALLGTSGLWVVFCFFATVASGLMASLRTNGKMER
jgi:hypothetical protein